MVRRKHRLLSLLTALAMLFSLMSGFTVFAEEDPGEEITYGLNVGAPGWDEEAQKPVFDGNSMGRQIFCEAGYHFDFTFGWRGPEGTIEPFTEEDMEFITVKDSEDQPVDIGLTPSMYGYYDEVNDRWEEAPAGDGIYRACFAKPGEYTITYDGNRGTEGFHEGATVAKTATASIFIPVVALYSDEVINADNLIGDEVTYMPGSSYYILAQSLIDDGDFKTESEILDIKYEDRLSEYVTLDEIKKGEIYKLTVSERMEDYFSIQVIYEQDDYKKDESQEFHSVREAKNDVWLNFNAPLRLGLVTDWTQWDDENPDQPVVRLENMRGNIEGYEIKAWNTFAFGWKSTDEDVDLIPVSNLDKFTAYDEKGNKVEDGWIWPATRWNEEADKEEELGDGYFNICFNKTGLYKIVYETDENLDNAIQGAVWADVVYINAVMPEVSIYSDETVSLETLLGSRIEYKDGARTFYANVNGETTDTFKKECTLTGYEFQSPGDADGKVNIIENGEKGYKIEISDDFSDQFNIRLFLHIKQSRLENDEWIDDGEWDRDYWTEFTCWTPERFGLVVDWTQWDDEDPDKPVVFPETMRDTVDGYQIMDWNTFTFGWKGEDGEVTLIPSSDIDKFTAYAEDGTKITEDWIHLVTRYNPEKDEDYLLGDGFFDVKFTDLGIHKIVYDSGESLESEGENVVWSDTVIINAVMPEVSLYSSETVSRETLIGSWAEYTDDERTFYVNILNDEGSDWKKEVVLRGFELEGPSDVSQNVNVIAANDGGYKVVIKDGYKAHFNLRVFVRINQYRKEDSEWRDDGGWDRDYWIEFDHWEPEYYGLGVAWPFQEGEDLPEFADELWYSMGMEAKADRTLCIGWTNAKGKITPIPLKNIKKLHLYGPDGKEVKGDWIRLPKRWEDGVEVDLGIAGMFEVTFPGTGNYVLRYDKDISGVVDPEGMKVTNECKFFVEYPDVGIYSQSVKSDEALIGEHVRFKDNRVFYVISADHEDSENIFTRTIKSYEVVMPYGFEDKADDTVTIEKVNDHTLKVTVAEDTELGFDLEMEIFSTNKYFDHELQQWVENAETWTDKRMVNFWPKEILHYGLVAGFPKSLEEGGPMGDMQQYLDGFFENYGQTLVFAWRDSKGKETQIRADDFTTCFTLKDENGKDVTNFFGIEKQENDDYIYDVWFTRRGLFYLYYDGDMVKDEGVEDTVCQNWIKIWVDPPFFGVYGDDSLSDDSLLGLSIDYTSDKLEYYLAGMSVGDERGAMKSYVTNVDVVDVENPDFVTITKNDDETVKVQIAKLPDKDFSGEFNLKVKYRIDSEWYDEHGEVSEYGYQERTEVVSFHPGDGLNIGKLSVSLSAEGAKPESVKICVCKVEPDQKIYYDQSGNECTEDNRWFEIKPGTPLTFEGLPSGSYDVIEDSETAAVEGYELDETKSVFKVGDVRVQYGIDATAELKNVYKAKQYPYKNEWKNGKWYNADGTQTYKPKGSWKHNSKGYWFGDTSGWYAKKCWQKIDGKSYYFDAKGYMVVDEYIDGYYLTKTGAWDGKNKAQWKGNATKGWWYSLPGGSYLKNCWAKIDGKYYYFKANGYAAKNEWVKGYYWIGSNCVWTYKPKGSWHKGAKGYWFGDSSGWYAKSTTIVIDGKSYTFDAKGYMK